MSQNIKIDKLLTKKKENQRITMLTAYDYPTGQLVDEAGVDIVLVGDSLANVVLGLDSTVEVGMEEMIHHAKAVRRGVKNAFLIGDMPFSSYQEHPDMAVKNAQRFIEEAGCEAIKLEWFDQCLQVAEAIVKAGIPVMGHVGLTPQTAEKLGGFKVQGRDADSAISIIKNAIALEEKGCFSVVLECMPAPLSKIITEKLTIPTISCGGGVHCDGQVLVIHDLLGLFRRHKPKFVKQYTDIYQQSMQAVKEYCQEVKTANFPSEDQSYSINEEELMRIYEKVKML